IIGESWFGVLVTSISPFAKTNQAQPDPKRVAAAFWNSSLNASKLPNFSLIFSASSPDGSPPPFGDNVFQNKLWLACPTPLLRIAVHISSGSSYKSLINSFNDVSCKLA